MSIELVCMMWGVAIAITLVWAMVTEDHEGAADTLLVALFGLPSVVVFMLL